jgi:hypothetical protein
MRLLSIARNFVTYASPSCIDVGHLASSMLYCSYVEPSQEITRLLCSRNVHCRVHNILLLVRILSQLNPVHNITPYFVEPSKSSVHIYEGHDGNKGKRAV